MNSAIPTNKVQAGILAGALAAIAAWALKTWGHTEMPAEIAVALSTVITFGVQYFVPDQKEAA